MLKQLVLSLALVLLASPAWATYYVDPVSGSDSNAGTSTGAPWKTCTKVNSSVSAAGSDVSFLAGTTFDATTCPLGVTIDWTGSASNHITITSYGVGDRPVFDTRATQSGPWTNSSGSIYYATNSSTGFQIATSDDIPLQRKLSTATMTAGTFYLDTANHRMYVWDNDSTDPSDNVVKYGTTDYYFYASGSNAAYIDISGLSFKGANKISVDMSEDAHKHNYSTISYSDSTFSGWPGFYIKGLGAKITWNDCSYSAIDNTAIDSNCMGMESADGGEIGNNSIVNAIGGSCIELNGNSQGDGGGTDSPWVHDNTGINCSHQGIEVWGCNGSSCTGSTGVTNAIIERNYFNTYGYAFNDSAQEGIGVGNRANGNIIRNNVVVGFKAIGIGTRCGDTGGAAEDGANNQFLYNTVVSYDNYSGAVMGALYDGCPDAAAHVGGNVFEGNLVEMYAGGKVVNFGNPHITSDYNILHSTSGTFATYNGTNYSTFASYKAASVQDIHSLNSDPQLDAGYVPLSTSPAIDAGIATDDVTSDYLSVSRPQGAGYDIGAYEQENVTYPGDTIHAGVVETGITVN